MLSGAVVPYLGPGVLRGVTSKGDGKPMPADSESLILAMNNGTPMAPKLMYEFPRAAMNLEQKKGRKFIERFLTTTYGDTQWSDSSFHQWLADAQLPYIIDINRDTQLQQCYAGRPHTLVVGLARIAGTDYRFKLYENRGGQYTEVTLDQVDASLPVLFKPMGTPLPEPNFIASDADYVDYITELMGGFAIPAFLKEHRLGKQYVFLGMRMLRDTERMVLSDVIWGAGNPAGWVLLPEPTDKEKRFCAKKGLEIVEADFSDLLQARQAA
ncbi:SIR2 family protein [Mangrovimicrobium sediminis]|uniref:SIR2 family protein n=2 Tax=Mangrovimicrobium sediminis TaxID=2562682 RepID=A0A4Z0M762_9GAMM|nr:SIR2 family protein [Haliea sp. SAOS-164]